MNMAPVIWQSPVPVYWISFAMACAFSNIFGALPSCSLLMDWICLSGQTQHKILNLLSITCESLCLDACARSCRNQCAFTMHAYALAELRECMCTHMFPVTAWMYVRAFSSKAENALGWSWRKNRNWVAPRSSLQRPPDRGSQLAHGSAAKLHFTRPSWANPLVWAQWTGLCQDSKTGLPKTLPVSCCLTCERVMKMNSLQETLGRNMMISRRPELGMFPRTSTRHWLREYFWKL